MKKIISLLLLLSFVASCLSLTSCKLFENGQQDGDGEDEKVTLNIIDDSYRNWYEIFVYSFYDSNNDGIGDHHTIPGKGNVNWREILPLLLSAPRLKVLQSEVQMFRNGLCVKETVESFERIFSELEGAK